MTLSALDPDLRRTGLDACAEGIVANSDLVLLAGGEGARRLWTAASAHDDGQGPRFGASGDEAAAEAIGAAAAGERVTLLASGPIWTARILPALREMVRLGLPVRVVVPAHGDEGGDTLPADVLDDAARLLDAPICVGLASESAELGPCVTAMAAHGRAIGRPCAVAFSLRRVGLTSEAPPRELSSATNAVTLGGDVDADEAVVGAGGSLDEVVGRARAAGGRPLRAVRVNRLRPGLLPAMLEALHGVSRVTVLEPFPGSMGDEGWLTTRVHRVVEGRATVRGLQRGDVDDSAGWEDGDTRDLTLMPLELRRRLDLVGLRVSLSAWQAMALVTRATLRVFPVDDSAARAAFAARVRAACDAVGAPPREVPAGAAWETPEAFALVRERAAASGAPLDVVTWAGLHDAHRFALHHLAAPSRDAVRFRAVLRASGAAPW